MANKVCPQRIIKEAIRLLEDSPEGDLDHEEAVGNCIVELASLEKALYRDGIINIEEFKI